MTQELWTVTLLKLAERYPITTRSGVDEQCLADAEADIGKLPADVRWFYRTTNGLRYEWFNVLPVEQKNDIKHTWDGIKRANNVSTSKFQGFTPELLKRFLIVAEIGGGYCACICRDDGSLWFEDADGIHQTDLTFAEFLETTLREVAEL